MFWDVTKGTSALPPAPRHAGDDFDPDHHDDLAAAFVTAWLDPHAWRHRRVDSVHLETGDQGRWRTSIDCTIPNDARLAYPGHPGQFLVPLSLMEKAPLRALDVADASGARLPVLGASENGRIALEMALFALRTDGVQVDAEVQAAVKDVVFGPAEASGEYPRESIPPVADVIGAGSVVDRLLEFGSWAGDAVLTPQELRLVSPATEALLRDFANGFLFVVAVPASSAGSRQVLKYGRYWHIGRTDIGNWITIAAGALGLRDVGLEIPIRGAVEAASYHLEVHTPPELTSEGLALSVDSDDRHAADIDWVVTPVAHAHGSYDRRQDDEDEQLVAWLGLGVTRRGAKVLAFLTSVFTFSFYLLGIVLPGGLAQLRGENSPDGAADPSAIVLTLPAVVIGLMMSTREHALAAVLLLPVRAVSVICAALLVAAAGALTFQLQDPYFMPVWIASLVVSGIFVIAIVVGEVLRRMRSNVRGLS